eukprot:7486690-Alexandrium_andersonii.AAC.1
MAMVGCRGVDLGGKRRQTPQQEMAHEEMASGVRLCVAGHGWKVSGWRRWQWLVATEMGAGF